MLIISALIVGALIYGAMALVTDCVVPWQQVLTMTDANGTLVKWHTGAVLDLAMGKIGVCFVALAVCMGIFTGMNGFFMTSSRLLFGMARAKMLPSAFEKVHPEHKTPSICVGFTMIICCICPFFGREVIGWVVDMCSVGTAFGYFFTCAPDRARFSCIHGSTVLCSTDRVGVDGSYLLFCFKEKFCESH